MQRKKVTIKAIKIAAGVILAASLTFLFFQSGKTPTDLKIHSVEVTSAEQFLGNNIEGRLRFGVTLYNKDGDVLNGYVKPKSVTLYSSGGVVNGLEVIDTESDFINVYCEVDGIRSKTVTVYRIFSSNLPIVVLTPKGGTADLAYAELAVYDNGSYNTIADIPEKYEIKYSERGNWSTTFPKPQYNIKFLDAHGAEVDVPLLGMTAGSDFVMSNTYSDKSLIRNLLAYRLGEQMLEASLESRLCEVWIDRNGNGQLTDNEYFGVYLIVEKINRKNVGISKEGGYLIARDKVGSDDVYFTLSSDIFKKDHGLAYPFAQRIKYPTELKITKQQIRDIQTEITALHEMLLTEPITSVNYKDYIDIDSYINAVLINEVLKNADGFHFSTYFYKNPGEKLKSGPVWDFDLSCGNLVRGDGTLAKPTGFYTVNTEWTARMMNDPEFLSLFKERYYHLRESVLSNENILGIIDGAVSDLTALGAAERHFKRFPELMDGSYNQSLGNLFTDTASYDEEIYEMKKFLTERLAWLDKEIEKLK